MKAVSDWSVHFAELEGRGYFILEDVLSASECSTLIEDFDRRRRIGEFKDAGIGSSADVQEKIRRSELIWLDHENPPPAAGPALSLVEDMRLALNRRFFLGLKDQECFYSVYRPGSYYRRHVDNFQGRNQRIVTFIIYLNQRWQRARGGELRIYWDPAKMHGLPADKKVASDLNLQECFLDVEPLAGRMVVFYAPELEHEVLPCHADRYCITGWLRR